MFETTTTIRSPHHSHHHLHSIYTTTTPPPPLPPHYTHWHQCHQSHWHLTNDRPLQPPWPPTRHLVSLAVVLGPPCPTARPWLWPWMCHHWHLDHGSTTTTMTRSTTTKVHGWTTNESLRLVGVFYLLLQQRQQPPTSHDDSLVCSFLLTTLATTTAVTLTTTKLHQHQRVLQLVGSPSFRTTQLPPMSLYDSLVAFQARPPAPHPLTSHTTRWWAFLSNHGAGHHTHQQVLRLVGGLLSQPHNHHPFPWHLAPHLLTTSLTARWFSFIPVVYFLMMY